MRPIDSSFAIDGLFNTTAADLAGDETPTRASLGAPYGSCVSLESFGGGAGDSVRASTASAYAPHRMRHGTVGGITINTLCNVMGAGVLALPLAMHNGSVITSTILLLVCAYLASHAAYATTVGCDAVGRYSYTECIVLNLVPVSKEEHRENVTTGVDATLANPWRKLLTMLLELIIVLESFGTLVVYTRVIGDSFPPVLHHLSDVETDHWVVFVLSWVVPSCIFFFMSCVRSMEELKWTSLLGFGTILYVVILVVWAYMQMIQHKGLFFTEHVHWFRLDMGLFASLSTFALAYGYHFNVPYFYSELKDRRPEVMMETVKNAFPIITASYLVTGLLGYLTFGRHVMDHGGGNIVDSFSKRDLLANIGRVGLLLHFASVYPVISVCARRGMHRFAALVGTEITREGMQLVNGRVVPPGDPAHTTRAAIILEAAILVLASSITAWFVPGVGFVVEVVGALFGIPTVFLLPGMVGYRVFAPEFRSRSFLAHCENPSRHQFISFVNIIAGFFAMLFGVAGTYWAQFNDKK